VLIVEDHPMLGEALELLLSRDARFRVIGRESTIAGAIDVAARIRPDLIVMDQHLPDGVGTDAAKTIRRREPKILVVMLTGDASDETLLAAVEAGVAGFIPKSRSASEIISLLGQAASGEIVMPVDDLARLLQRQDEKRAHEHERQRGGTELTTREREILDLMATGSDTKQIAFRTGLSVNTVRGHIQAVIEKLATHSRLEAVLRATTLGLLRRTGDDP
jgi:DNA-binding NarL/FixJ family response regulator